MANLINLKGIKLNKLKEPKQRPESEMKNSEKIESYYDARPEFRIEGKDMPEIKDWKVGEEYTVIVKVRMEGMRARIEDGKEKTCGDFRIVSIGAAK